ncbi:MAG TPA: hypothetical protein VF624_06875 [Tepidisphaeraceae bacterium]|jgi:hypothetical protein
MPFRIFAVGHGGPRQYNYINPSVADEADIDKALAIKALAEGDYSSPLGAAQAVNDANSAGAEDIGKGAIMYGKFVFSELIQTGVQYLQMSGGAANGKIMLSARETNMLWPDTARFVEQSLDADDAGYQFMKKIKGALSDTNMYTNGALRKISDVLSFYGASIQGTPGATPWLSFQLHR